jgi:hypothetical protein
MSDELTALDSQAMRMISKSTPREQLQAIHMIDEHYQAQNLYKRMNELDQISNDDWNADHEKDYNACDKQHIIGFLSAEKKACRPKPFPWSPSFRDAANRKAIWNILLSRARTNTKFLTATLEWIRKTLKRNMEVLPSIEECRAELRKAQLLLKNVKKRAKELRMECLLQTLDEAIAESEQAREKAIRNIIRSQEKLQSFARLRQIFKPKSQSGLAHLLIATETANGNNEWETVAHPETIHEMLRQRNIQHFGMAHGTPCTHAPLTRCNWEADFHESEQLIEGKLPDAFGNLKNKYLEKLIHHIQDLPQLPEIDCQLTPDEVSQGFRKWREATSTSPSGCHLGLRRIASYCYQDEETEKLKTGILLVQTQIINLPLRHGFSPHRWQKVVNAMIKKIPNHPYINKLRVIHLLEADYNLCLKAIFGQKLTWNCEEHKALGDVQNGFRPGRSTLGKIITNELMTEYNRRMRINSYIIMMDIAGCFDRLIPSITSILNRKNGVSKQAVQMHGKTLRNAQYYLKTKFGIFDMFYSHTEQTPIYGNGQGAGDSPSQWNQESAVLISLFHPGG